MGGRLKRSSSILLVASHHALFPLGHERYCTHAPILRVGLCTLKRDKAAVHSFDAGMLFNPMSTGLRCTHISFEKTSRSGSLSLRAMDSTLNRISALAARNSGFYEPLPGPNAIRLLHLEPGKDGDPISCALIVVEDYQESVEYYALSHCWGLVDDITEILCNKEPYFITHSLRVALERVRSPKHSCLLWVDALCIYQHDDYERNQQVSVMKQIYSQASRVLVWLGPGDEHTNAAIEVIYELVHKCCEWYFGPSSHPLWLNRLRSHANPTEIVRFPGLIGLSNDYWPRICPIYENGWFRRIWVIQEVQGCEDTWLLCGKGSIEWDAVALVARWVSHEHQSGQPRWIQYNDLSSIPKQPFPPRIVSHRRWRQYSVPQASFMIDRVPQTSSDVPFLWLLHKTRCFQSSDSRDKVFAMLQHPVATVGKSRIANGHRSAEFPIPRHRAEASLHTIDCTRSAHANGGGTDRLCALGHAS